MAERKRIGVPISGLDTSTPDHSVVDGKCETLHNLRYTGGAWRNMYPFVASDKLPDLEGNKIIYHHPADVDNAYITYSKETTEGITSYTFYRSEYGYIYGEWRWSHSLELCTIKDTQSHSVEEVFQIGHFGKMLIIGDNISKTFHLFFWGAVDTGSVGYHKVNYSDAEIALDLALKKDKDGPHLIATVADTEVAVSSGAFCGVSGADGSFSFESVLRDTDFNEPLKLFRGEFVVVAALVSEEGEIIKTSPFRLFNSAMEIEKEFPNPQRKPAYKSLTTISGVSGIYTSNAYKDNIGEYNSNQNRLENWPGHFFFCEAYANIVCKNIYSGSRVAYVDIYASRLYNLIYFKDKNNWGDNTIDLFSEPMYRIERKPLDEMTMNDNEEYEYTFHITSETFENIEHNILLSLSQGIDDLYGKIALEYNNRLHLSDVRTKIKLDNLAQDIEQGRDGYDRILAQLSYDGQPLWANKIIEKKDKTLILDSLDIIALEGHYTKMYFSSDSQKKKKFAKMRYSALYNTSFGYEYADVIEDEVKHYKIADNFGEAITSNIALAQKKYKQFSEWAEVDALPNISPNVFVNEIFTPNAIRVSAANIPYSFPFANSYRVGSIDTKITTMQSAALNLSDNKFGEFPVYVFTNEGVWAMQSGKETLYSAILPINNDVILSPHTLAVNNSIFYTTDKGLYAFSSQGKVNISRDINSLNNRIPQWFRDTRIVYLPEWNEIMVFDSSTYLIYVYSLDNNVWSTRSMPKGYVINSGELVAYEGKIYNLRNEVESFDSNALSMLHPSASTFSLMRSTSGDDTAKYKWVCEWGVLKRSGDEDRQITLYDYDEESDVVYFKGIYVYRPTTPTSSLTRYRFKANVRAKLDAFDPRELIFIVADDGFHFGDIPFGVDGYPEEPRFRNVEVYTPDGSLLTTLRNLDNPGNDIYIDTRYFYDNFTPNGIDKLQYGIAFDYQTWGNYNNRIRLYPYGYFFPYHPDNDPDILFEPEDSVWNDIREWFNVYYADDDRIFVEQTLYFDEDDSLLHYAFNEPLAPEGAEDPYVVCVYNNGLGDTAYRCTQEEQDLNDNPFEDIIRIEIDDDSTEGGDGNEGGDSSHSIVLSQTSVDVSYEGGDYSVEVESTCSWNASSNADWVSVNTTNGFEGNNILSFSVATNSANSTREAIITLNNSEYNVTAQLLVVQAASNQGGGNEGGGNEGGGNIGEGTLSDHTSFSLHTRPIKLGTMELKRAETIIVRFESDVEQELNIFVEGSVDTRSWGVLREMKVVTNKDIEIRRTPCSVKYLRFSIQGRVSSDIRILAFELEYYERMRHRMR